MQRPAESRAATALALALVVLAGGCAGASPADTQTPAVAPPQAMECDVEAFPCAFADVPGDVRAETERLAAEANRLITAGATNAEVVTWLDAELSVAEVEGDSDSVRFRPTGGRGVWITRRTQTAPASTAPASGAVAHMGAWDSQPIDGTTQTVTGEGRSERRALVLSPFRWDFGDTDDGRAVADRLGQIPEYANGVTYAENSSDSSTDVTVDDFRAWHEMQVVHLVSHGTRLCGAGKCRAVVAANGLPGGPANIWPSAVRGIELEVEAGPDPAQPPRYFALLGADFFRDQYPGGLGDTVVFLNGCSTFGAGATDLADAIRGTRSVVLGWSRPVDSAAAYDAALAMYAELAGNGRTVGDALELLGDLTTDESQGHAGETIVATLTSTGRAIGGDLRIRDVVTFQDAQTSGPLAEDASVPLVGEPGDGAPDSVSWQLRVDGIQPEAAAAIVQVTIDGHAAQPVAVSTGTVEGTDSWRLSGVLDLGVDVSVPHPAQFEASLQLPEGGASGDVVPAVLVGVSEPTPIPQANMGTIWRGQASQRRELPFEGVFTVAEAELTFTLNRRNPDLPVFAYELTGGTMTYSVSGTRPDGCTYELAATEITITQEMAESAGEFVIDARDSPPTFYGFVNVTGPVVEVMQTCPDPWAYLTGLISTRATAIFIDVSTFEPGTVIGDRISGTSSDGTTTFDIARAE